MEQQERVILKGEQLRKGDPLVIASRSGTCERRTTEADELRSKFEQARPVDEVEPAGKDLLQQAERDANEVMELARRDAAALLENARNEAQSILAEAQSQADSIKAEMEPKLRSQLEAEIQQRYGSGLEALVNAASALEDSRSALLASLELPAFEMVQSIARQLLQSEIHHAPEYITGLIRNGLALLNEGREICLRLNPEVHDMIVNDEHLLAHVQSGSRRGQQLTIEADPQLSHSAFRLLTEGSEVGFDLDESLRQLDAMLAEQLFPAAETVRQELGNG